MQRFACGSHCCAISTTRKHGDEMTRAVTPDHIMQLGMGFWASKTDLSAVEFGVFSALAKAPADLETLRGQLKLHPRAARDFLDARVALKC